VIARSLSAIGRPEPISGGRWKPVESVGPDRLETGATDILERSARREVANGVVRRLIVREGD
jgi:hypothetical protein